MKSTRNFLLNKGSWDAVKACANKYCNYLHPNINNSQVIVVMHHIHVLMLRYTDTLPHDAWLMVWLILLKMSFPTKASLGIPLLLTTAANKPLELLTYAMDDHPLYRNASAFPLDAADIDGRPEVAEPADESQPKKKARKALATTGGCFRSCALVNLK